MYSATASEKQLENTASLHSLQAFLVSSLSWREDFYSFCSGRTSVILPVPAPALGQVFGVLVVGFVFFFLLSVDVLGAFLVGFFVFCFFFLLIGFVWGFPVKTKLTLKIVSLH